MMLVEQRISLMGMANEMEQHHNKKIPERLDKRFSTFFPCSLHNFTKCYYLPPS